MTLFQVFAIICTIAACIRIRSLVLEIFSSTKLTVMNGEVKDRQGVSYSLNNNLLALDYYNEVGMSNETHNLFQSNYVGEYLFRGTSYRILVNKHISNNMIDKAEIEIKKLR